jgi:mannose/cellobiose epimerase-like protein (N-acyl-D-glucosamine 2-epimerase family)
MRPERQTIIDQWLMRCFGQVADARNPIERALRLVEEAIELAQCESVDVEMLHRLVDRVYDRPVGDEYRELGGVGVCLLAYAAVKGYDADRAEATEVQRVLNKSTEHFAQRQIEKNIAGVGLEPKDSL